MSTGDQKAVTDAAVSKAKTLATGSLVFLLLATLLFAQFAATNHELTVRHTICLQHGEVVDVEGRDAPSATSVAPGTQFSATNSEPLPTHHQHCLFVASRGKRNFFRVAKPSAAQLPRDAQPAVVSTSEVRRASVAAYLIAPKHSPPLA